MLRFRSFAKSLPFHNIKRYSFSTASFDPYYVLGVEKSANFDEVKKKYYKLAAEYHPDINKDPESFELIRKWQGKAPKIEFETGRAAASNFRSVRPNAGQYSEESTDDGTNKDDADFKEWEEKARMSEEHAHMAGSFRTVFDIRDIKFTPTDVEIPDPSKRFDISNKERLKGIGDSSKFFIGIVTGLILMLFYWMNKGHNVTVDKETEARIENLMKKDEYTEFIADNREHVFKNIEVSMKQQKNYINFVNRKDREQTTEKAMRSKLIPDFRPVLTKEKAEELST